MLTSIEFKQGLACCHMNLVVICKLHYQEPVSPIILSVTYKDLEICLYLLVHTFCLAISLGVVGSGWGELDSQEGCKVTREVGYEGVSVVTDHFLWKSVMWQDMFQECPGHSRGIHGRGRR